MDKFSEFLRCNISEQNSAVLSRKYTPGISHWNLLEEIDPNTLDILSHARFLYVRNLVLSQPIEFKVPFELDTAEQALMYCSFGAYKEAIAALNLPITSKIIGAEAKRPSGASLMVLVANLENTTSKNEYEYEYDGFTFSKYTVSTLTHNELIYLYIKIRELESCDDNREITQSHIKAYVNRALFDKNELNDALLRTFHLIKTGLSNETTELVKLFKESLTLTDEIFSSPITFTYQLSAQIGRSLMACYDYGSAYDVLSSLPFYDEKIECLIGMKKPDLASKEIHEYIRSIGNADERSDQITLCNLYIKLGYIHQNPSYFDTAASFFHSAKPYQLKGLFLFNRKEFAESASAFKTALEITPNNEEIRFSYACSLVELNRISEALKIFRLLKAENPQNENISKNLSFCFYKLKDIENTLSTLKSVALSDQSSMKQLLYIGIQNDRLEYVEWALQRISFDSSIEEAVNYIIQTNKIGLSRLREILEKNVYLDANYVKRMFERTV
ncbi:hypothetical protein PAEPH01_0541 [Pancytospora epiphaga]|nr:hypothetical protein PAEPH01_0541 [Pancytospora epiphaga]